MAEYSKNAIMETDDFSREKVPDKNTYGGFHIALIVIGGTIGMAVFLMAAQIGGALGLQKAAEAFAVGGLILGIMGALTSYVGAKTRYSASMLITFAFGKKGAILVNMLVAVTLIGWYAVISNVFGQAANIVLYDLYDIRVADWFFIITGSALMIGVTLSGFQGIDKLALYLVPFMVAFIGYAALSSGGDVKSWVLPADNSETMNFSLAVSAVVGTYIIGVIIQPDYSRFARNIIHATWAVFIALGVSFPIILFLTAIPGAATGKSDLMNIMIAIGIGLPAFFLLLLGAWSSNVLCLYSSSLSISTILTRHHLWKIILVVGSIGTILALLRAQEYFTDFLVFLGITIPPIGAIYLVDSIFVRRQSLGSDELSNKENFNGIAFVSWIISTAMAYASVAEVFSITKIAALDSILVAAFSYAFFSLNKSEYKIMSTILLENGLIFDGSTPNLLADRYVLVKDERIFYIGTDYPDMEKMDHEIDLKGRTIMPGLIDAHFHAYAAHVDFTYLEKLPMTFVAQKGRHLMENALKRGFTTVRDAGGADHGLWLAIEQGLINGPRLFYSGRALSQTGGHGDVRKPYMEPEPCSCASMGNLAAIVDGVDEVRKTVRETLRQGAHQIKIFVSGGIASPSDPIWMLQFSNDEILAAVDEAERRKTYVLAHAYTGETIERAIQCGVRSIEHANLITPAAAQAVSDAKAYVVPTLVTYSALATFGKEAGVPKVTLDKLTEVKSKGLEAIDLCRSKGVNLGFGTDLLGEMHSHQLDELKLRSEVNTPFEVLNSATAINAELMQMEGEIGCVREGAFADMLIVDGNPLENLDVIAGENGRPSTVIKSGKLVAGEWPL